MLQYALLHLFGYALSMDDLKQFRVCTFESSMIGFH
jgi:transketolase